VYHYSSTKEK